MPQYTYQIGQTHHTWTVSSHIPEADENGRLHFTPQQQEVHRILLEMLAFWIQVAKKHRVAWFAMDGTLLGAVRNKGLIPFDDDIDLGVPIGAYPTIERLSMTPDLHPEFAIYLDGGGCFVRRRSGQATPAIDILLMGLDDSDQRYVHASPVSPAGEPRYFLSHTFPKEWVAERDVRASVLRWVPFEHLTIPIPRHARRIVQRIYGDTCLTTFVRCPHIAWTHGLRDHLPVGLSYRIVEWALSVQQCDYRTANLICQITCLSMHFDIKPISIARFLATQLTVTRPKRAVWC